MPILLALGLSAPRPAHPPVARGPILAEVPPRVLLACSRARSEARRGLLLLIVLGTLSGCGSTRTNWFARSYRNTHAYFNGYYHAHKRYQEAVKSADQQYVPPAEGFLPLIDGAEGGGAPSGTLPQSLVPLPGVPLPTVGGEYGGGVNPQLGMRPGQEFMPGGLNQPGQPGAFDPSGRRGGAPAFTGFNPNADPLAGGGVSSIPAMSPQRGPQASLFNDAPNWGPGGSRATSATALLDECVKKCEYMIFRRSKSDWVDDARLLLARAAFQQRNYGLALQNLEALRATYPNSPLIPDALLWQAKINYQFDNSVTTRALLDKVLAAQQVKRETRVDAALLQAQLLTRDGEYNKAIAVLDDNLEELSSKKDKVKVNFLLGQLYDQRGNYTAAYEHFQRAAAVDYSSLMTFRSQLALVNLQIKYQPEVERGQALRRELAQMANQGRFAEFHDQIEHQVALQAIKERNYPEAERHFLLALQRNDPRKNPLQRSTTYYELGKLYFDRLSKLDRAQAYFDSAARTVKPEFREARRIQATAASLKSYVRYRRQAADADSLLRLSQLSPGERAQAIDDALEAEDEAREQAALLAAQRAEQQATAARNRANDASLRGPADPTGLGLGELPFDNPALADRGRSDFIRVWGNRPNVDNWRRSRSIRPGTPIEEPVSQVVAVATAAPAASKSERRAQALSRIPATDSARALTTTQLADALYSLAQTFADQLELPDSAIRLHESILARFGEASSFAPRSLYALYRLYGARKAQAQADARADLLAQHFPDSPFTRLVRQLRSGSSLLLESGDFESGYTALFAVYTKGDYGTATTLARFLTERYATHPDAVRLHYLRAMAEGALGRSDSLKAGLEYVVAKYPSHSLATLARETLAALQQGVSGKARLTAAPGAALPDPPRPAATTPSTISPDADLFRTFVAERSAGENIFALILVDQTAAPPDPVREAFDTFNKKNYAGRTLNTSVFSTLDKHLVYISQFENYGAGKAYLDRLSAEPTLKNFLVRPDEQVMLATATNFRIAFTQRRFTDYVRFYRSNIAAWLRQR